MKSYKTFNEEELAQWKAEVTKYMTEVHPKLDGIEKWEDMPKEFFDPGCELAKAIVVARDIANNPKQYKVKQAVKVIGNFLRPLSSLPRGGEPEQSLEKTRELDEKTRPLPSPSRGRETEQSSGKTQGKPSAELTGTVDERGVHISEYLYMLPDDVQAMTEKLPELYLQQTALANESDDYANQYERAEQDGDTKLMDSLAKEAEPVNRELVKVNQDIRAIYEKVDECVEYYKKHGETMPALGGENTAGKAAGTVAGEPSAKLTGTVEDGGAEGMPPMGKKPAECTKAEIDAIADPALQNKYMEIRIEANKKYLRRTDMAQTDEWKEQVRARAKELVDWEVKITDKIRIVMEMAGVTDL